MRLWARRPLPHSADEAGRRHGQAAVAMLDLVQTLLLGSTGTVRIDLYGSADQGFDIDNVLTGKLTVCSSGAAFA